MNAHSYTVLYVDDEPVNLELFKATFRNDFDVMIASGGEEALQMMKNQPVDVVVTDWKMPKMNGMDLIEQIKRNDPNKICILLTAFSDPEVMIRATNEGKVFRYMLKPWLRSDMKLVLSDAFSQIGHQTN
jgi:response regulator RpfG family c-di-GMP phosphodiesterase